MISPVVLETMPRRGVRRHADNAGYVFVISFTSDANVEYFYISRSINPRQRERHFQDGNPFQMHRLCQIKVKNMERAERIARQAAAHYLDRIDIQFFERWFKRRRNTTTSNEDIWHYVTDRLRREDLLLPTNAMIL